MLYQKLHPNTIDKKAWVGFLRNVNLEYMCIFIHNFLFNIVMPRLGSRDYVSDREKFYMYKVMVGKKVNLL